MEFKTIFGILKTYMADGDDIPTFFRNLIAMLTTVGEEEWGTNRDPSQKLGDETIRSYTKRQKLPSKLAKAIVYRLTPEILEERIGELETATRELLAKDLQGYDAAITAENVGKKVAEILVKSIRYSAGLVEQTVLVQQRQKETASALKNRYGEYLLREANGFCNFPGCGRRLSIALNDKIAYAYEVTVIDKSKAPSVENLLAACPQCQATYALDENNKKLVKELKEIKIRCLVISKMWIY